MTRARILLALAALILAAALAGCSAGAGAGDSAGGGGDGGDDNGADTFVLDGFTFTEAGSDPWVFALENRTAPPPGYLFVAGASGFIGAPDDYEQVAWFEGTASVGSQTIGTEAYVEMGNATTDCAATGGTVTVTALGALGGAVTGTINVTAWAQAGTSACPATPTTGSFSATRDADDSWGNDGSGDDTFSFTPTGGDAGVAGLHAYTENDTTRYDPLIYAFWNSADSFPMIIHLSAGWNATAGDYDFEVGIYLNTAAAGTYTNASGFLQINRYNGVAMTNCGMGEQSIEITATGAAGSFIEGTFSDTSMSGGSAGCPTAVSGSFNVLREADEVGDGGGGTPTLTAAPTLSPSTFAAGDTVTASVPVDANVGYIYACLVDTFANAMDVDRGCGGVVRTPAAGTASVLIVADGYLPAGSEYWVRVLVFNTETDFDALSGTGYFSSDGSSTYYMVPFSAGTPGTETDTGWAIATYDIVESSLGMDADLTDTVPEITDPPTFSASTCPASSCTGISVNVPVDAQTGYIAVTLCPVPSTQATCTPDTNAGVGSATFPPGTAHTESVTLTVTATTPGTYFITGGLCVTFGVCNQSDPGTFNFESKKNPGRFAVARYPSQIESETGVLIPILTLSLP